MRSGDVGYAIPPTKSFRHCCSIGICHKRLTDLVLLHHDVRPEVRAHGAETWSSAVLDAALQMVLWANDGARCHFHWAFELFAPSPRTRGGALGSDSWAGSIWRVRVYPEIRLHEKRPRADRPWLQVIGGETPEIKNSDLMMTYNNPLVRARKPKKKKPSRTKARQRKGLG